MKTRNYTLYALGLAAALSLVAGTAAAQAKSDKRIPVRKDAPPMEAPKVDTVRIIVRDTIMLPGRRDTVVRTVTTPAMMMHDTVMQMLPMRKLPGVYFGLGGGVTIPMNNWRNSTKDGPAIQGILGWFPNNGSLGLRIDGVGNFFGHRSTDCPACPSPRLWEGNADVVLRMPLDRTSHLNPVFYIMGGGGIDKFTDFLPYRNSENRVVAAGSDTYLNYPNLLLTTGTRGTKSVFYNYNAGLGLDWTMANLHWYVESKYTTINTIGGNSHYWPVTAGLKFY